nr:hypothetical protein [Bacteroidota bacterium]
MDDEHKGNYLQKNTKDKVDDLIEFIQSRKEENELMKKIIEKIKSDNNLKIDHK